MIKETLLFFLTLHSPHVPLTSAIWTLLKANLVMTRVCFLDSVKLWFIFEVLVTEVEYVAHVPVPALLYSAWLLNTLQLKFYFTQVVNFNPNHWTKMWSYCTALTLLGFFFLKIFNKLYPFEINCSICHIS